MAEPGMDEIAGGCHCGNVRVALAWPGHAWPMPARACGCAFCAKHGGVWSSHPAARLVLRIKERGQVSRYRFGTGTAEFQVCRACGAVPAVTWQADGRTYAVVNVNCLEGLDAAMLERAPVDFEGERLADRLARRRARWIAEVTIENGAD